MLLRITAKHFVAGIVIHGDTVLKTAPIVKYMKVWDFVHIKSYCAKKGWKLDVIAHV